MSSPPTACDTGVKGASANFAMPRPSSLRLASGSASRWVAARSVNSIRYTRLLHGWWHGHYRATTPSPAPGGNKRSR